MIIFPHPGCGEFWEKWNPIRHVKKWRNCGVEREKLWRNSWKTAFVGIWDSTGCGKGFHIGFHSRFCCRICLSGRIGADCGNFSPHPVFHKVLKVMWKTQKRLWKVCWNSISVAPDPRVLHYAAPLSRMFLMVSSTSCLKCSSRFIRLSTLLME